MADTDATTVPKEIRLHALRLALEAIERYLAEVDVHLDHFGRIELLDIALDDLEAEYAGAAVN